MRAMLLAGQVLDGLTFALFFSVVPASVLAAIRSSERNPIVAATFAFGGIAAVLGLKLGLTWWVVLRDRRRTHRPRLTGVFMGAAALSGFVGSAFNLAALRAVMG